MNKRTFYTWLTIDLLALCATPFMPVGGKLIWACAQLLLIGIISYGYFRKNKAL